MSFTNLKNGSHAVNWMESTLLAVDSRRVFIAEEDPFMRKMLVRCFEKEGRDVIAAANGRILLEYMKGLPRPGSDSGDVLLTDVEMPEIGGFDLMDELRSQGWTLPVVFMSGYPSFEVMRRAQERNAHCFFMKPFSLQELSKAVDTLGK
jgi:CheY-like chemotaxis protein